MSSVLINLLAEQPTQALEAALDRLRKQQQRLSLELAQIEEALAKKGQTYNKKESAA